MLNNYHTIWTEVFVQNRKFKILQLENFEKTVDHVIQKLHDEGKKDIVPEDCPYFGQLWAASKDLASWMNEESDLENKTILEIGSGLALPSILCLSKGATVEAFDLHEDVIFFIQENLKANNLLNSHNQFYFQQASWNSFKPRSDRFDFIIGSDILYENQHPSELIQFLNLHLKEHSVFRMTDPCRWHHLDFISALQKADFKVKQEYHWTTEDRPDQKVKISRIEVKK